MFSIFDGFVNALNEALNPNKSKFDTRKNLTSEDLTINNIPDLYNCKYTLDITDVIVCNDCNHMMYRNEIETGTRVVDRVYDDWDYRNDEYRERVRKEEEEYECCPYCHYGEDEDEEFSYYELNTETLYWDFKYIENIDDYTEKGFKDAFIKYIKHQEEDDEELKTESVEDKKKPEKDDENFTKLKETVKKEMYKYLKSNGIDIEHLIKSGVELDTMKPVIDKMLDTYVATSIADYENEYDIGLAWDYEIGNNDIIISIDTM